MKLRILFHKRIGEELVGVAISVWTWILAVARLDFKSLKYNLTHAELWWPDENRQFTIYYQMAGPGYMDDKMNLKTYGFCFSSTTRGKYKGVRIAPASEVLHNPDRWAYIEVEVSDEDWARFKPQIERMSESGIKYDFLGLFGFFFPINIQDKKRYYCSELVAYILWRLNLTPKRHKRISPRRLAKVLSKLYGEPKPL